jgi:hypothetical protein
MKKLKNYWVPITLSLLLVTITGLLNWEENSFKKEIVTEGLQGNANAIKILQQCPKPEKLDRQVVREAIKGNLNALLLLNIEDTALTRTSHEDGAAAN